MRRLSVLGTPLLCLCCTGAVSIVAIPQSSPPEDLVRQIENSLRTQNNAQAIALADKALRQLPRDKRLWALKGIANYRAGKLPEALVAFNKSLALAPDYLPALEGAAQVEFQLRDAHAATSLQKVIELKPDDSTANAMLAVLDFQQKDCPSAIEHFAKAGRELLLQPSALAEYGSCLLKLKRSDQAVSLFQGITKANPGDERARYNLAVAQFAAQYYTDALATLQPLLDGINPDPDSLDLSSAIAEAEGDTPKAVRLLREAIVASPRNPQYYLDFSSLCFDHRSFDAGVQMLDAGLRQLPADASLHIARGILYVQEARYDEAEADFEKAEALDPRQSFSPFAKGLLQYQESDLDGALITTRRQLQAHPRDASLHFLLAEILMQKGAQAGTPEFQEAFAAAQHAVKLNPNDLQARDVLANILFKAGDLNGAVKQCRIALGIDASDQTALYHLMMALRKLGQKEEIPGILKRLADIRNAVREQDTTLRRYEISQAK